MYLSPPLNRLWFDVEERRSLKGGFLLSRDIYDIEILPPNYAKLAG